MNETELKTYIAEQAGIELDTPDMQDFFMMIEVADMGKELEKLVDVVADTAIKLWRRENAQ